jgi:hypothetical protein
MRATSDCGAACGNAIKEFSAYLNAVNSIADNFQYRTPVGAAVFFNHVARAGNKYGWEVGANMMRGLGGYHMTDFHSDYNSQYVGVVRPSSDETWYAIAHTHPGNDPFSGMGDYWNRGTGYQGSIAYVAGSQSGRTDMASAFINHVNSIMTMSNGSIWMWDQRGFESRIQSGDAWTVYVSDFVQQLK